MSDYAQARIRIGGPVTSVQWSELCDLIQNYALCIDWGGPRFDGTLPINAPLDLYHDCAPGGQFDALEQYCVDSCLAYRRWSGGCIGAFLPEIIVHRGDGKPLNYASDEDEHIVLHEQTIRQLGSYDTILAYLADGEFEPPPFEVAVG